MKRPRLTLERSAYRGVVGVIVVLIGLAGCATGTGARSQPETENSSALPKRSDVSVCAEGFLAGSGVAQRVARYSARVARPLTGQVDLLDVILTVTLPREVRTVSDAIDYLLTRSGYRLAEDSAQGPKVMQLLKHDLPQNHRRLGPITLEAALLVLMGPPFRLVVDPVHRLIGFEMAPAYQKIL